MRSRYSAYVVKNYDYILVTYDPIQQQNLNLQTLRESSQNTTWLQLEVLNTTENEDVGTVEFIATYSFDGHFFAMHELSSFIKQAGNWYYTTGLTKEKTGQITPTRNDVCPCGSGKKYKKCCLA